jgi:hypothetical protein
MSVGNVHQTRHEHDTVIARYIAPMLGTQFVPRWPAGPQLSPQYSAGRCGGCDEKTHNSALGVRRERRRANIVFRQGNVQAFAMRSNTS